MIGPSTTLGCIMAVMSVKNFSGKKFIRGIGIRKFTFVENDIRENDTRRKVAQTMVLELNIIS